MFKFPIKKNSKIPLVKWKHGSSNDLEQIQKWQLQFPDCNFGINCGASGLVVIDIDGPEGENSFFDLQIELGPLPETFEVKTPNGRHLYFIGATKSTNKFRHKLDIKSVGGMVLAAGSKINDKEYLVSNNPPIAQLPANYAQLFGNPGDRKEPDEQVNQNILDLDTNLSRARQYVREVEPAIEGNNGDTHTINVIRHLRRRYGLSPITAFELLDRYWNPNCQPPWDERDLKDKIRNAFAYDSKPIGCNTPEYEFRDTKKITYKDLVMSGPQIANLNLPDPVCHLIPWIKSPSIVMIAGERGVGKSHFAHAVIKAISTGEKFGPWEVGKKAKCLLVDGEMTVSDVKERVIALKLLNTNVQVYCDAHATGVGIKRASLYDASWRQRTENHCVQEEIQVLIIDNIASLSPGVDENKKEGWDEINQWLIHLRNLGIAVVILHHTGKSGGQRGTSGREDNIDTSVVLKKTLGYEVGDGAKFVVEFTKARISNKFQPMIKSLEFKLNDDYEWEITDPSNHNVIRVVRRLADGMKQKEIAEELGVGPSTISKLRRKALANGVIDKKNNIIDEDKLLEMTGA